MFSGKWSLFLVVVFKTKNQDEGVRGKFECFSPSDLRRNNELEKVYSRIEKCLKNNDSGRRMVYYCVMKIKF